MQIMRWFGKAIEPTYLTSIYNSRDNAPSAHCAGCVVGAQMERVEPE